MVDLTIDWLIMKWFLMDRHMIVSTIRTAPLHYYPDNNIYKHRKDFSIHVWLFIYYCCRVQINFNIMHDSFVLHVKPSSIPSLSFVFYWVFWEEEEVMIVIWYHCIFIFIFCIFTLREVQVMTVADFEDGLISFDKDVLLGRVP